MTSPSSSVSSIALLASAIEIGLLSLLDVHRVEELDLVRGGDGGALVRREIEPAVDDHRDPPFPRRRDQRFAHGSGNDPHRVVGYETRHRRGRSSPRRAGGLLRPRDDDRDIRYDRSIRATCCLWAWRSPASIRVFTAVVISPVSTRPDVSAPRRSRSSFNTVSVVIGADHAARLRGRAHRGDVLNRVRRATRVIHAFLVVDDDHRRLSRHAFGVADEVLVEDEIPHDENPFGRESSEKLDESFSIHINSRFPPLALPRTKSRRQYNDGQ